MCSRFSLVHQQFCHCHEELEWSVLRKLTLFIDKSLLHFYFDLQQQRQIKEWIKGFNACLCSGLVSNSSSGSVQNQPFTVYCFAKAEEPSNSEWVNVRLLHHRLPLVCSTATLQCRTLIVCCAESRQDIVVLFRALPFLKVTTFLFSTFSFSSTTNCKQTLSYYDWYLTSILNPMINSSNFILVNIIIFQYCPEKNCLFYSIFTL